jgi:hypothetical protein
MTAPGFVFCGRMIGQTGVGRGSGPTDAATGRMVGGEHLVAYQPDLQLQPEDEKIPVNFLLFTGGADSPSPQVVLG